MPLTAATGPALENSDHASPELVEGLDLLGCILLYQHRQDQAIGITWMSARVRGLLWYYVQLQEASLDRVLTAAYLNGMIQQGAAEIKRLVKEAETVDLNGKHAIAKQVIAIQEKVETAKQRLDLFHTADVTGEN